MNKQLLLSEIFSVSNYLLQATSFRALPYSRAVSFSVFKVLLQLTCYINYLLSLTYS